MAGEKQKGAPPVGLWLKVGPDLEMDMLVRDLKQIFFTINSSAYEKNMHALEISGAGEDEDFRAKAALLCAIAQSSGIACIYRGDPVHAREIDGVEGVLVDSIEALQTARALFGEEGIVGLYCGTSQDLAAQAYDAGADFVSFGMKGGKLPSADVLRFWTMLSDKPAVIEGPVDNDYCAYFVQAGAGFIDAGDYIWSHGKGVMQGTVNMLYAIDLALAERQESVQ